MDFAYRVKLRVGSPSSEYGFEEGQNVNGEGGQAELHDAGQFGTSSGHPLMLVDSDERTG